MTDFIVAIVCLLLALLIIELRKAYFSLPLYEVKRLAARDDKFAKAILPIISHGSAIRSVLWLILGLLSAVSLVLLSRLAPIWLGICLVIGWLWLAFSWLPNAKTSKFSRRLGEKAVPVVERLMQFIYPLAKGLGQAGNYYQIKHTGLYETEDLHQLLNRQERQSDNRISTKQLGRLKKLMAFDKSTVSRYQRPWETVVKLSDTDTIGPKLLDDMHRSGQIAFPVIKGKSDKTVVGILCKEDVGLKSEGRVSDHMRVGVKYLNRSEPIESALAKFALSNQALFLVVNKAEDVTGILTLKDALNSLLDPEAINTDIELDEDQAVVSNEPELTGEME